MADVAVSDQYLRTIMVDYTEPQLQPQLPTETPFLNDIEQAAAVEFSSMGGGAYKIYEPLELRIPQGHGVLERGDPYPDATQPEGSRAEFQTKFSVEKLLVDEAILNKAAARPKMVAGYLQNLTKNAMTSFRMKIDGTLHYGAGGAVAIAADTASGATVKVADVENLIGLEGAKFDIRAHDSGATARVTDATLVAVNDETKVVTFDKTLTNVVATDWILWKGSSITGAACQFGVPDAIGTANVTVVDTDVTDVYFGGINRTTAANAYWKGQAIDASSYGGLTFDLLHRAKDKVRARSPAGMKMTRFYMRSDMKREFLKHYVAEYPGMSPDPLQLKPGYKGIAFEHGNDELAVVESEKVPSGEIWGVSPMSMKVRYVEPIGWRKSGGHPLLYADTDYHQSYAYLIYHWQFTANCPKANIRIHSIPV